MFLKNKKNNKTNSENIIENCTIKTIVEIQVKDYVAINKDSKKYYGGRQNWWKDKDNRLYNYGCGVIAMSDLQSYILEKKEYSFDEYEKYIKEMLKKYYGFFLAKGVPFWKMMVGFYFFMRKNRKKVFALWGPSFRKEATKKLIFQMLKDNKPVPAAYYVFIKKHGLMLYRYDAEKKKLIADQDIKSHYFVINAMVFINNTTYLKISSWGEVYYIKLEEWIKKLSPFSNILYWKLIK